MYSIVKKIILVSIFCLFWISGLSAEKGREVLLRYSQQENIIRIVLEAEDVMIKNSRTITSLSSLRIEFPFEFEIKKQRIFSFETTKMDRWISINLKDIADVRTYKLTSPARIVFELKTAQKTEPPVQPPLQEPDQNPFQETVRPPEKPYSVKKVVIDAGHGGYEFGITSNAIKEKNVNLSLAKDLAHALSKKGLRALLTRKVDQSLTINDRTDFSNRNKPDLFLGIHSSLSDKFVIYVSTSEDMITEPDIKQFSLSENQSRHAENSRKLSNAISEALKIEFKTDIILREMPLPVLSQIDAPAVLIEYPALTSVVYDQKMIGRFVNSIIMGIAAYEE